MIGLREAKKRRRFGSPITQQAIDEVCDYLRPNPETCKREDAPLLKKNDSNDQRWRGLCRRFTG
jgi:hypothetical protein